MMTNFKNLKELRSNVELRLVGYQKRLDKFSERFASNPAYAFQWAEDAMFAAAQQSVDLRLLSVLDHRDEQAQRIAEGTLVPGPNERVTDDDFLGRITEHYRDEALRMSDRVASSTSEMEDYDRAATVQLYRYLNGDFMSSF
jgi:hypothetical protein